MTDSVSFSCCLIGGDTLLSQCGDLLLERGAAVRAVVTSNPVLQGWARGRDLEVIDAAGKYSTRLAELNFDYLFSITHLAIIPEEVLALPRLMAINFHDGLLPYYAGLNTPMWALLDGAQEYGITWHQMSIGLDEGDILLRVPVEIGDDETALSLNTKCFAAAVESFPRLLNMLEGDGLQPVPQDHAARRLYLAKDRPDHAGFLDWQRPARDLAGMVRALYTGSYVNALCSAKTFIGDSLVLVDVAREDAAAGAPGELLRVEGNELLVGCATGSLAISQLRHGDGTPVDLPELLDRAGLRTGERLPRPAQQDLGFWRKAASDEAFWTKNLAGAEALELPGRAAGPTDGNVGASRAARLDVPERLLAEGPSCAASLAVLLGRLSGRSEYSLAVSGGRLAEIGDAAGRAGDFGFVRCELDADAPVGGTVAQLAKKLESVCGRSPWPLDLVARQPALRSNALLHRGARLPVLIRLGSRAPVSEPRAELTLWVEGDGVRIEALERSFDAAAFDGIVERLQNGLRALADERTRSVRDIDLLSPQERSDLLHQRNQTDCDHDRTLLMHSAFETLAARQPDATAVVAEGVSCSYGELWSRADRLARKLVEMGVQPGDLIGAHVPRNAEMMVATVAILKAGAAYVPLDPAFPADRLAFMIEDSSMALVLSHSRIRHRLTVGTADLLEVDRFEASSEQPSAELPIIDPAQLAYVIYTSGSTGRPKGVMIEHRNVVNFFAAMDAAVPEADRESRSWLAVTSLSFDISVLELFWTLNRGFKVVIHDEAASRAAKDPSLLRALDMGLFMWGNDDAPGPEKYRLLMEGSRFFDENGFSAVWTPERHFHAFGGPYPNPAVTGAAVAAITKNVRIRAGSCVVPLHHPVRIAEEWAVVDNLSKGRVEIAAASGWNPNDFVLRPENHADNKNVMYSALDQVRRLWRGEKLPFPGPLGSDVEIQSLPRPVQEDLPCWITTAGNPDTWREAGRLGLNVLTHLLGQTVEEVAEKVALYRAARQEAGYDPASGRVALMLHTFVGEDNAEVKEIVREPMKSYLGSSMRLAMDYAWSFPAFKRPGGEDARPEDVDLKALSADETDTILEFAFERYFEGSGLFGDVDTCLEQLGRCSQAGVDEIACLMDFGVDTQAVMDSLPRLKLVRERMVALAEAASHRPEVQSLAELIRGEAVTHLQCTPSTARMYLADSDTRQALSTLSNMLVGGEALPVELAKELKSVLPGTLTNMYGPTETTIWSLTDDVSRPDEGVTIGRPIANTRVYLLDAMRQPVPEGTPGELFIGGEGVARGYHARSELTAERFLPDPFSSTPGGRMYATGDLARYRSDGRLEFLGRTDFQVKVRGYRIELGEIESRLEQCDGVAEAAVVVRDSDAGDQRLVAIYTVAGSAPAVEALRTALRANLPEYMIPNEFQCVEQMPRTANGKLDRKALMAMEARPVRVVSKAAEPASDLERIIIELWKKTLKLDAVGLKENFFDLGGHSLLVVQLHGQLKQALDRPLSLTDLYQYPTVKSLADYLAGGGDDNKVKQAASRGERRRAMRQRRAG